MTEEEKIFAERLNEIIKQKLEIACKICGISVEDTTSGKKHINLAEFEGKAAYIYAERQIALVVINFRDDKITVRRIRRYQYRYFMAGHYLKSFFKTFQKFWYEIKKLFTSKT